MSDPLKGPEGSAIIREIEKLLQKDGAPAHEAQIASLQVWACAEIFIKVSPRMREPFAVGEWLVDELTKSGQHEQAESVRAFWPDLSRPLIEFPPAEMYKAAADALNKARGRISAFPANSHYARSFGKSADETLERLQLQLTVAQHVDGSQKRSKNLGGAPETGGFKFFIECAVIWKNASGKWPPITGGRPYDAIMVLLGYLGAHGEQDGTSEQTFKEAVGATKKWYAEKVAAGAEQPDPAKAKFEVQRPSRERRELAKKKREKRSGRARAPRKSG